MADTKENIAKLYESHLKSESDKYSQQSLGTPIEGVDSIDSQYQSLARRTDPNEFAALNQTTTDWLANSVGKAISTAATGTVGGVASLYDIPRAILSSGQEGGGWDYLMNNSFNKGLSDFNQFIHSELPVYQTKTEQEDALGIKDFVDGGLQAIGFIGSSYGTGAMLKGISAVTGLNKALGSTSKILDNISKVKNISQLETNLASKAALSNYLLNPVKNVSSAMFNRVPESLMEAYGTGEELKQKLDSENEEAYNTTGQFKYTEEEINQKVQTAQKINFGFNLALGSIDALQSFKPLEKFSNSIHRSAFSKADDVLSDYLSKATTKSQKALGYTGKTLNYLTLGGGKDAVLEGLEELSQFSSNKLAQNIAINNPDATIVEGTIDLFKKLIPSMKEDLANEDEAKLSALLGGIIGIGMGSLDIKNKVNQEKYRQEVSSQISNKVNNLVKQTQTDISKAYGLYKMKYGSTDESKADGYNQTRFAQNKSFQLQIFDSIVNDDFEGALNKLDNLSETTDEELKQLGINTNLTSKEFVNTEAKNLVGEAKRAAWKIKDNYDRINTLYANNSEDFKLAVAGAISDIDHINSELKENYTSLDKSKQSVLNNLQTYSDNKDVKKVIKKLEEQGKVLITKKGDEELYLWQSDSISSKELLDAFSDSKSTSLLSDMKYQLAKKNSLDKLKNTILKDYENLSNPIKINKVEEEISKNKEELAKKVNDEILSTEKIQEKAVEEVNPTQSNIPQDTPYEDPKDFYSDNKIEPDPSIDDIDSLFDNIASSEKFEGSDEGFIKNNPEENPFVTSDTTKPETDVVFDTLPSEELLGDPLEETKPLTKVQEISKDENTWSLRIDDSKTKNKSTVKLLDADSNILDYNLDNLIKSKIGNDINNSKITIRKINSQLNDNPVESNLGLFVNGEFSIPFSWGTSGINKEDIQSLASYLSDNKEIDVTDLISSTLRTDFNISDKYVKLDNTNTEKLKQKLNIQELSFARFKGDECFVFKGNNLTKASIVTINKQMSGTVGFVIPIKNNGIENNLFITLQPPKLKDSEVIKRYFKDIIDKLKDVSTSDLSIEDKQILWGENTKDLFSIFNMEDFKNSPIFLDKKGNGIYTVENEVAYPVNLDKWYNKMKDSNFEARLSMEAGESSNKLFNELLQEGKVEIKLNVDEPILIDKTSNTFDFKEFNDITPSEITKKEVKEAVTKKADIENKRQIAIEGIRGVKKVSKGKTTIQYTTTGIKDGNLFPSYSTEKGLIDAINAKYDAELASLEEIKTEVVTKSKILTKTPSKLSLEDLFKKDQVSEEILSALDKVSDSISPQNKADIMKNYKLFKNNQLSQESFIEKLSCHY